MLQKYTRLGTILEDFELNGSVMHCCKDKIQYKRSSNYVHVFRLCMKPYGRYIPHSESIQEMYSAKL